MKRTILYYPHMVVRNPSWLRQMILYWDEIGTIVPGRFAQARVRENKEIQVLAENGLYRAFEPDHFVQGNQYLAEEFFSSLNSEFAKKSLDQIGGIYIDHIKFSIEVLQFLLRNHYAQQRGDQIKLSRGHAWIYMSLLAKYMANEDKNGIVTPGTDYKPFLDVAFSATDEKPSPIGLVFSLNQTLPSPREDVPIKTILDFKSRHKEELLKFRQVIYSHQDRLRTVEEKSEVVDLIDRFSSEIKYETAVLGQLLLDEKIPLVLGAMENILKIGNPSLIAGLASMGTIPLPLTIAGTVIAGSLSLRKYQLDIRNERQKKLAANSFSYLYHANQENIIHLP